MGPMVQEVRSLIRELAATGWLGRFRSSSVLTIASGVTAACVKARGGRAILSTPSRNRAAATKSSRQVDLQGILGLAMASLVTGTSGAYAEGLGLLVAVMESRLPRSAEGNDPPYRPRS